MLMNYFVNKSAIYFSSQIIALVTMHT